MIGKKDQLLIIICISLMVTVAVAPMNIQLVSADNNSNMLSINRENPYAPANISEIQYCDVCHADEMPDVWLTVTVDSQTTGDITYFVTGSDIFDGEEGWAVFDSLENNIENGHDSGTFTLPKNGKDYRVYWVDNGTGGTGESGGGSAYEDITPPNEPPSNPTISGKKEGNAGDTYSYEVTSIDPEGQTIFYYIDWGDGTDTDWFGPFNSGDTGSKSHSWAEGTFTITAKTRDQPGLESGLSEYKITMPKSKSMGYTSNILNWLFEHFPNLFPILEYLI